MFTYIYHKIEPIVGKYLPKVQQFAAEKVPFPGYQIFQTTMF